MIKPFSKPLLPPTAPKRWYDGLAQYQQQGIAHVLTTVVAINGSAPRALQTKMIVTNDDHCDTLGGGGLEHDVMMTARQLLNGEIKPDELQKNELAKQNKSNKVQAVRREAIYTKHYPLGAKLAQCCGGSVTVMFECFNVTPPLSLLVFGAGHVAAALMTILGELPCQVDWVDSRSQMFERYTLNNPEASTERDYLAQQATYQLPAHIRAHVSDEPTDFLRPFIEPFLQQLNQRFILIMTHDHSLDFDLVRAAFDVYASARQGSDSTANNDAFDSPPYIGCISSTTKANRFKERLLQRGYDQQDIDNLTMPIGLAVGGKEPMAVAVSIAAQILQRYHSSI